MTSLHLKTGVKRLRSIPVLWWLPLDFIIDVARVLAGAALEEGHPLPLIAIVLVLYGAGRVDRQAAVLASSQLTALEMDSTALEKDNTFAAVSWPLHEARKRKYGHSVSPSSRG